jgi:glycosyltransferase involved in cell wall biosynthesis
MPSLAGAALGLRKLSNSLRQVPRADYSAIQIVSDAAGWVLDYESRELAGIFRSLGIPVGYGPLLPAVRQCVHYTSHAVLEDARVYRTRNRFSVDYFHGLPGTETGFTQVFDTLRKNHDYVTRIRSSHSEMHEVILASGIDPAKVHRIPIGINPEYFPVQTPASRAEMRKELGIPISSVVIGSFQKDGNGWGEGNEPKHVKGPDVFLKAIEILRAKVPELHVLLTGPARGFVKNGLDAMKVPYTHRFLDTYEEVGRYFQALDAYIVASRQEGGPKAVLESMSSGVPLITTRVGQAMDLVLHGKNGWMVGVGDAEGLAHWTLHALGDSEARARTLLAGRKTSLENSYEAQTPLWKKMLHGYVASTSL